MRVKIIIWLLWNSSKFSLSSLSCILGNGFNARKSTKDKLKSQRENFENCKGINNAEAKDKIIKISQYIDNLKSKL